jgi:hypothetical protein
LQSKPSDAHVFGVHGPIPHWLGIVAPQTCMPVHVPHMIVFPQPSEVVPHLAPSAAQVVGLHSHLVTLQVNGAAQLPQSSLPPQPSSTIPHSALACWHVFGGQAHTFGTPPPPHIVGARHAPPQLSIVPQPSETVPQFLPCTAQLFGVHPH